MNKINSEKGSATVEYVILLPIIFACVLLCIFTFIFLYEQTQLQNLADDIASSLSRQWGYKPLPVEEINTGVYKKETYESREIYWHLKLLGNNKKESTAEEYIRNNTKGLGLLKPYVNDTGEEVEPEIFVDFKHGIPSTLLICIRVKYSTPAKALLKLIGMEDYVLIEAKARASVYDSKDMINNTDYIMQIIRETKTFKSFTEKIKPLKDNIDKFLKE